MNLMKYRDVFHSMTQNNSVRVKFDEKLRFHLIYRSEFPLWLWFCFTAYMQIILHQNLLESLTLIQYRNSSWVLLTSTPTTLRSFWISPLFQSSLIFVSIFRITQQISKENRAWDFKWRKKGGVVDIYIHQRHNMYAHWNNNNSIALKWSAFCLTFVFKSGTSIEAYSNYNVYLFWAHFN